MEEALVRYHPQDCIGCQKCTRECPSARNGGIIPHLVVESVNNGNDPSDVWKCLQCQRCSSVCPKGIEVSEIVLHFRCRTEMPEKMRKTFEIVGKYGRAVMPSPMADRQRAELGLQKDEISDETVSKIRDCVGGFK